MVRLYSSQGKTLYSSSQGKSLYSSSSQGNNNYTSNELRLNLVQR